MSLLKMNIASVLERDKPSFKIFLLYFKFFCRFNSSQALRWSSSRLAIINIMTVSIPIALFSIKILFGALQVEITTENVFILFMS